VRGFLRRGMCGAGDCGVFWGAQRGSEIGKWKTGRITVKKQEISQNDRKNWIFLEKFKEKLRILRSKGGENL